ncbi:MAG TPA: sugar ABC transporter permease [Acidimicrobiales bacterium]|nr:sugar ABC transporter permease [Acidimicrobiales bacterium]
MNPVRSGNVGVVTPSGALSGTATLTGRPPGAATGAAPKRGRTSLFGPVMILPTVVIMLLLGAYPVITGIIQSFSNETLGGKATFAGLANYRTLLSSGTFGQVLENTVLWTVVGTIAAVAVSTVLALLLAQPRRNAVFQLLWIIPWAMPQMTLAIIFLWLYTPLVGFFAGWAQHFGVVFPALLASPRLALWAVLVPAIWSTYSFGMLFIHAALLGIDPQLVEAARIDGASTFQQFRLIKLPLIGSVVRVVALLDFLWLFNQFAVIWIMTEGGPGNSTQIFSSYAYYEAFMVRNIGFATAIGVVMLVLLLAFVIVFLGLARRTYGGLGVAR